MKATSDNMDVVTNNLSNAESTGFKRKEGVQRSFPEMVMSRLKQDKPARELGSLGTGVHLEGTYTDFRDGDFRYTEGDLDFAIDGDAFFVVETPEGEMFTRAGNFSLNQEGHLVTQQGYPVLAGNGQPLENIPEEEVWIDENGVIQSGLQGGEELQLASFTDSNFLSKRGENLYQVGEAEREAVPEEVSVRQYYLEESNVDIVEEMVNMIEVNRLYEANQKTITAMDDTLGQAVNQIADLS